MPRTFVALDLEFTGLDRQRDEIIEIGLVCFRESEVLDTFASPVHAYRAIPYKIEQLSGITQDEIDRAPTLSSLKGQILAFVRNYPVVGHNIEMDLHFLKRQGCPLQNLAIDTFELASILFPEVQTYSLENLVAHLGITVSESHRALPDALATKDLFVAIMQRLNQWDLATLEELARLGQESGWPLLSLFRDVIADRRAQEGEAALAPGPRRRRAVRPAVEEEAPALALESTEAITPLDADELAALISPEGPFARSFAGYEHRIQQIEMLRAVCEALNAPSHLLVEAGTGTGKSLAYLLPAIRFATQNHRRVVISSNTINLQDQLFQKDIPDIQSIQPIPFRAALLKGRSNYLCMRRLEAFRRSRQLNEDQARVMAKVLVWLPQTETGDRAELLLINEENQVWGQIESSAETCMGDRCPYMESRECFFYRARGRAHRAHIIVVNHALLISDLMLDSRILPEYHYLIIDEAHHLEEQATNQFGLDVGRQDLYTFLTTLGYARGETPQGLLGDIPRLYADRGVSATIQQSFATLVEALSEEIEQAQRRLYELFEALTLFLREQSGARAGRSIYGEDHRLTPGLRVQPDWLNVEVAWEQLSAAWRQVLRGGQDVLAMVQKLELSENAARDDLAQLLQAHLMRGAELWSGLDKILMSPDEEGIYWVSVAPQTQEVSLHSAPLHVGYMLNERLFMQKDCIILTSATLCAGGTFDYIKERLGLEDPMELAVDSPFDFKTAVLLYVPKDIPEPNEPYYQKTIEQALIDLVVATEGRTLVLFTSNSQLNATYRATQAALDKEGIVVFGQGIDGSRRQVLRNFRSTPRSVLMGTRSFWEGIDVVGEALSCLVITRLPFSVPTDPVFSARAETFDNAFEQFYLPEAILRFRQGFGRLIRSQDDYGVVALLDKRILTKSYGKLILRSLPPCTARQGPLRNLPEVAQRWLDPAHRK
jgi:DNA polymerase-3 subunit epsilon/ATP-dependent DNA helicase DinG